MFKIPDLHKFATPGFAGPAASGLRKFAISELHRFKIPDLHKFMTPSFAGPGLQIFTSSRFRSFTGSRFLKTHFTNFVKLDVSRLTGFSEFPNI
jgi:hypothetical protein